MQTDEQARAMQQALDDALGGRWTPDAVIDAWLDAGARTSMDGVLNAIDRGQWSTFGKVMDALSDEARPGLSNVLRDERLLRSETGLSLLLDRLSPDELNYRHEPGARPWWLNAFRWCPDDASQNVLTKLLAAGADLDGVRSDPVYGLHGKDDSPQALVLRVEHERRELRASADEATRPAPPVPSLGGLAARLDARENGTAPTPDAPRARRRL